MAITSSSSSSVTRNLFQNLICLAIQRCRLSGTLCRLSVSIKCSNSSNPHSLQLSISDTGVGSSLSEFQRLDVGVVNLSPDRWDGVLSVRTTGIHDENVCHYLLNLGETETSKLRLRKLPSTHKNHSTFSGTEVCFSTGEEDNIDDFTEWALHYVRKIMILKAPNLAIELSVEHVDQHGPRRDHLLQQTDDIYLPLEMPNIDRLLSGLQDYVLKHRSSVPNECQYCLASREHLKVATSTATNSKSARGSGQMVDAAIVIAPLSSQACSWRSSCSTSQVLYFQDFSPSSLPASCITALGYIDWEKYGLRLKGNIVDGSSNAVLEWEDRPLFAHMDVAIHCYSNRSKIEAQEKAPDRNLVKKAVKLALDDLKAKTPALFLSCNAQKICQYVPDLSSSIAGLILSSNDSNFQGECAALLGLDSVEACSEGKIETCISQKIIGIIEMNDKKQKKDKESAPSLFQCENVLEEFYDQEEECEDIDDDFRSYP